LYKKSSSTNLASKAICERSLSQCMCPLKIGVDLRFDFADGGQVAIDFGDDAGLLRDGWQGNWQSLYVTATADC